jgi:hypothetical protein
MSQSCDTAARSGYEVDVRVFEELTSVSPARFWLLFDSNGPSHLLLGTSLPVTAVSLEVG